MYRQLMVELGYREITLILMGILCRSGGLDFASEQGIVRTGERVCEYVSSERMIPSVDDCVICGCRMTNVEYQ